MQSSDADFVFHSSDDSARHYWYAANIPQPPGASTQWLAFRFRLRGMIAHSPASHFAIALRARLEFDPQGTPVSISGRGMTLGDTSLAAPAAGNPHAFAPGFGGARGTQVESFWPGGNFLYRETALLPDGLVDGRWYRVQLHVNDERWIALQLLPEDAAGGFATCVQDRAVHPVIADASGGLIALGRGLVESGPWSAEFREISTGWF